jgi:hypothetical protein
MGIIINRNRDPCYLIKILLEKQDFLTISDRNSLHQGYESTGLSGHF